MSSARLPEATPTGLEPATFGVTGRRSDSPTSCKAKPSDDAAEQRGPQWDQELRKRVADDPRLARLVAAWPKLPDAIRAMILATVEATVKR